MFLSVVFVGTGLASGVALSNAIVRTGEFSSILIASTVCRSVVVPSAATSSATVVSVWLVD